MGFVFQCQSSIFPFFQKNDGAGKDLISIDDVDSCLIEEYVENLNLRNNLSQGDHNFLQSSGMWTFISDLKSKIQITQYFAETLKSTPLFLGSSKSI